MEQDAAVGRHQPLTIEMPDPARAPATLAPFALGFRPFFLAAGVLAVVLMGAWLLILQGSLGAGAWATPAWHGHEMLFGFTIAVIAGFLLTAVRNWTGLATPAGPPLAALFAVWLAGRLAWMLPDLPPLGVALADLAFLPVLAIVLARPILRARQFVNLAFPILLLALAAANALVHLEALALAHTARLGLHGAASMVVMIMVIVGGRVVPSFTDNRLGSRARRWKPIEMALPWLTLLALLGWLAAPGSATTALLAALAAVLHGSRLAGWYTRRVWSVPLLWVLHLGYAWLPLGFALLALAAAGVAPAQSSALHAFTAGGIGVLTLGMMARVSLGHTGRLLEAPPVMTWAFVAINLAALLRVVPPLLMPAVMGPALLASGLLWIAAFALFVFVYVPMLLRPRADGKPG